MSLWMSSSKYESMIEFLRARTPCQRKPSYHPNSVRKPYKRPDSFKVSRGIRLPKRVARNHENYSSWVANSKNFAKYIIKKRLYDIETGSMCAQDSKDTRRIQKCSAKVACKHLGGHQMHQPGLGLPAHNGMKPEENSMNDTRTAASFSPLGHIR